MTHHEGFQQIEALLLLGHFPEADNILRNMEKAGQIKRADLGKCHVLKSSVNNGQGQFAEALASATEALAALAVQDKALSQKLLVIDALHEKAWALMYLVRYDESWITLEESEAILDSLDDSQSPLVRRRKAHLLRRKGWVSMYRGHPKEPEVFFQRSLEIFQELDDQIGIGISLNNLGFLYRVQGNLLEALTLHHRCLAIAKDVKSRRLITVSHINMGWIYLIQGEYDSAINSFQPLLKLLPEDDQSFLPITHFLLITAFTESHALQEAYQSLRNLKQVLLEFDHPLGDQLYRFSKAIIWKASPRMTEKAKAMELLQEILKEEKFLWFTEVEVVLALSELLIDELKFYGEKAVLEEIRSLLLRIPITTSAQHNQGLMVHTTFLRAKIHLVEGNIQEAEQLLIQAAINAEEKGLFSLAKKAVRERENLNQDLIRWSALIDNNADYGDRLQFGQVKKYLKEAKNLLYLSKENI